MAIKIEKDVLLPTTNRPEAYPFADMKVGDSFCHPGGHHSAVYNLAKAASYRLSPKKFQGGKDAKGNLRVWRVA